MDTEDQFTNMMVSQLKHYLHERDIVVSHALKKDLVACCCAACLLSLQPKATLVEYTKETRGCPNHHLRGGWEDRKSSYPHLLYRVVWRHNPIVFP